MDFQVLKDEASVSQTTTSENNSVVQSANANMQKQPIIQGNTKVNPSGPTIIKVVGCGGGGSNAVNNMIKANIQNVDFVALNTDLQALNHSLAKNRIAIGQKLTQGLGAGSDPAIGEQAANEDKDAIMGVLKGANMVFITAGMGGGTGTGSAPIVAQIARDMGILTVGIVTTPFDWEGPRRMETAQEGIAKLRDAADSVIIIPDSKILEVYSKELTFIEQFRAADDLLRQAIEGVSNIITLYGMPNIDFADVSRVMKGQGTAIFGIGRSSGENRAVDAATKAIHNPLLEDVSIDGAMYFLVNVCAGKDFKMSELAEISKIVSAGASEGYELKPGFVEDDSMGDELSVTVIATGFGQNKNDKKTNNKNIELDSKVVVNNTDEVNEEEFSSLLSGGHIIAKTPGPFDAAGGKAVAPAASNKITFGHATATTNNAAKIRNGAAQTTFGNRGTNMDVNDPNTPAVLRKNLSRTINFKRK